MTAEDSADPADSAFAVLGVLGDPVRRRLYRHVAATPGAVGRDAAAEAVGVTRSLAAFHLDKLAEAGLLDVSFQRLSGRTGPGAGRPAKVYRRAEGEHSVSVPPRSYDAAGRLLAEVVENAGLDRELQTAARAAGAADPDAGAGDLVEVLRARGYQPFWDGETLRLHNCPFHALATEFPALVCGMNLALLEGLASEEWSPAMDPCPGGCCVALSKNKSD
ncbi:helix-turn-helix domain-containing protein [Streptomyces sp. NPDC007851]|uniref:helix-turn-helix transcriptional regulator n=1 Tax=Streptomyces sp. NPDC007851 TaxID=3155008 RepID=UPI0033E15DB1